EREEPAGAGSSCVRRRAFLPDGGAVVDADRAVVLGVEARDGVVVDGVRVRVARQVAAVVADPDVVAVLVAVGDRVVVRDVVLNDGRVVAADVDAGVGVAADVVVVHVRLAGVVEQDPGRGIVGGAVLPPARRASAAGLSPAEETSRYIGIRTN